MATPGQGPDIPNELVIPSTAPAPLKMDSSVNLIAELKECSNMIKWWTQRREMVQEQLREILGDHTIGTVNGREAIFYEYQERFNSTDFKKKYPNLYHAYTREVTETKLDVDMIKHGRPDLYHEFQVRAMRVVYEAPGESK